VVQEVEYSHRKHKALSSIPTREKERQKERERERERERES
jgi:hypothetical protein